MMQKTERSFVGSCLVAFATCGTAAFGEGPLGEATTWFDETYRNFTEVTSNKWTTSAGTWRKTSDDDCTVHARGPDGDYLQVDTRGGEIQFTPKGKYAYNARVQIDADATFTACRLGEEWDIADASQHAALADFDSMVSYWLSQFVPGNNDASSFSRYSYMDADGKMKFAPAWDFDYGLGSLQIRSFYPVVTNAYGQVHYAPIQPERWIPARSVNNFMGHWTADPYFTFKLRERYFDARPYLADMVKDGGLIDQYKVKLAASARANDLRWNNRIGFFGNAEEKGDVDTLKEFLARRFAWLDRQFATVGCAVSNASETVNVSALRYARSSEVVPTFAGASPVPGSVETDVVDVSCPFAAADVEVTVCVPNGAARLDAYLNGRQLAADVEVLSGRAQVNVPRNLLKKGKKNFFAFVAKDADGTTVGRNVALLTCIPPPGTHVYLR